MHMPFGPEEDNIEVGEVRWPINMRVKDPWGNIVEGSDERMNMGGGMMFALGGP